MTYLMDPSGILNICSKSKSSHLRRGSIVCFNEGRVFRGETVGEKQVVQLSVPIAGRIGDSKVSSDQRISPVSDTSSPRWPVWLNRCASDK